MYFRSDTHLTVHYVAFSTNFKHENICPDNAKCNFYRPRHYFKKKRKKYDKDLDVWA